MNKKWFLGVVNGFQFRMEFYNDKMKRVYRVTKRPPKSATWWFHPWWYVFISRMVLLVGLILKYEYSSHILSSCVDARIWVFYSFIHVNGIQSEWHVFSLVWLCLCIFCNSPHNIVSSQMWFSCLLF